MSAEIYQFLPRANPKADRSIPHLHDVDGKPAFTFRGKTTVLDTAPSEYVAPDNDPA